MPKYILLVEDDEIAAVIARRILEKLNCQIDRAKDGKAAVELASRNQYDLVLMDLGLPMMDGLEACKEIRLYQTESLKAYPVPIIGLTANLDQKQREKCIEAGMNDVLSKPLTVEQAKEMFKLYIGSEPESFNF